MPISWFRSGRRPRARSCHGFCRTLHQRLLLGIGLPLMLLQAGVFWLEYGLDRREELAEMRRELTTLTRLSAARLEAELARLPGTAEQAPSRLGTAHLRQLLRDADFQPGELLLLSDRGELLASDDRSIPAGLNLGELARWTGDPALTGLTQAIAQRRTGMIRLPHAPRDRQPRWVLFTPVRQSGGAVVALVRESAILAQLQSRLLRQAGVFVVGSLLILAWLALLTSLVTRPLARLAQATRQVGAGDWSLRIAGPFPRDEVGRLMRLFNRMLNRLQHSRERELTATAARERVESELKLALRIQQSLLPPDFAPTEGWSILSHYKPARFVAGDFYDYFLLNKRTLAVAIADVSGKGISAALFMAAASTCLRNFSRIETGPAATLTRLNRELLQRNRESLFLTLFLAWIDLPSGRVTYANAGHNSPYRLGPRRPLISLGDPTGPLLAVLEEASYGDRQLDLAPGETLILFTDGLVEAADPRGKLFGEEHLEVLLAGMETEPPAAILNRLQQAVEEHCRGVAQDDLTLLLINRSGDIDPARPSAPEAAEPVPVPASRPTAADDAAGAGRPDAPRPPDGPLPPGPPTAAAAPAPDMRDVWPDASADLHPGPPPDPTALPQGSRTAPGLPNGSSAFGPGPAS